MTQRRSSIDALVLYVLLAMNIVVIAAGFTVPQLQSGFTSWVAVNWPKAVGVYGSIIAFGGISALVGAWSSIQRIRGKQKYFVLLGPALVLVGLMTVGLYILFYLITDACVNRNACL